MNRLNTYTNIVYFLKDCQLSDAFELRFNMIVSRTFHVNLTKTLQSILYLSCAIGDTFVFLAVVGIGRNALYHCNINGRILYEYKFQHSVDSFAMPSKSEVVILYPRGNKIYHFDLNRYNEQSLHHEFMYEQASQSEVFTFSLTGYLCVREKGCYIDNRLHLTYYQHHIGLKSQPISYFHSKDDEWVSDMDIFKADSHSLFVWCKRKQDDEIDVRTFDLRNNPKGQFRQFRFKNNLGSIYNLPKIEIGVKNIFEIRPHQLCLVCFSSKNVSRAVNKDGVVNNNFILNTESPHSPYIVQSKFYFERHWNDHLIDCFTIGAYSVFHTYNFRGSQALSSPVFFLNFKGQLICSQSWKCTFRTKFFIPGYSDNIFFEAEYENGNIDKFTIHQKTVLNPNQSLRQKLKQLYQEFDQQLQMDVFDLLQSR